MTRKNGDLLSDLTFEKIMSEADIPFSYDQRLSPSDREYTSGDSTNRRTSEFRIIDNLGKLSSRKSAATFAFVDWNGHRRYDLRAWNEDFTVPFKGLTFTIEEIRKLYKSLSSYVFKTYTTPVHTCNMGKATAKIFHTVCELSSTSVKEVVWTKQVSIVDWGYGQKYDFRKWTEDYDRCSKGICLNHEEVEKLQSILEGLIPKLGDEN